MSDQSEQDQNVKLREEIDSLKREMWNLRTRANEQDDERDERSLVVAYALWFLLGGLGFHRFYMGSPTGLGQLVLTIISVVLFFVFSNSFIFLIATVPLGIWLLMDLLIIPDIKSGSDQYK